VKYVKDPIARKSGSMTGGVHHSDKSQLKKIAKIRHKPKIPQVPIGKLYMRVKGVWVFKGTFCRLCNVTMNDQTVIDNHRYICNALNTKEGDTDAYT
jgi:hypothetical protein